MSYEDTDNNPANGGVTDAQGMITMDGAPIGGGVSKQEGLEYVCGYGRARFSSPFELFEGY
jgi:hypothetical protein